MPGIRQTAGTNGLLTVFPKKTCGYMVGFAMETAMTKVFGSLFWRIIAVI